MPTPTDPMAAYYSMQDRLMTNYNSGRGGSGQAMAGQAFSLPPGLFFGPGPINPYGAMDGMDGQNGGFQGQGGMAPPRRRIQGYRSGSARGAGVGGALSQRPTFGGYRQYGGSVNPYQQYVGGEEGPELYLDEDGNAYPIGEEGPEAFVPPRPGVVVPSQQTQFRMTPAARVFGMGLGGQSALPPPTFRGTPIFESRDRLSPLLRENAMQEQSIVAQELAMANQQRDLARQAQVQSAEDAALNGIASGDEIGNIFKNNPALALSRNASQIAAIAQPSRATQTLAPSLSTRLPVQEREIFNKLIQSPDFASRPAEAYHEAQRLGAISKQNGELVKAGVPLSEVPQELLDEGRKEALIIERGGANGKRDPSVFLEKHHQNLMGRLKRMDDAAVDPATPAYQKALADIAGVESQLDNYYASQYTPKVATATPEAATAENITSPSAMGGQLPPPPTPQPEVEAAQAPVDEDTFLQSIKDTPDLESKKKLLGEFKKFAVSPVAKSGETIAQALSRRTAIQERLKEAELEIEAAPEIERYGKEWTKTKDEVASIIKRFAKSIGVSPEQAENSLIADESIRIPGRFAGEPVSIRNLVSDFVAEKPEAGVMKQNIWDTKPANLNAFAKSKFAERLGRDGLFSDLTYGDVLDEYLKERKSARPVEVDPNAAALSAEAAAIKSNLLKGVGLKGND